MSPRTLSNLKHNFCLQCAVFPCYLALYNKHISVTQSVTFNTFYRTLTTALKLFSKQAVKLTKVKTDFADHTLCELLWKRSVSWSTAPSEALVFPVLMFLGGVGRGQGSCWVQGWDHKDTGDTKSPWQCKGQPFHNLSQGLLRAKAKDPGEGNPFISF